MKALDNHRIRDKKENEKGDGRRGSGISFWTPPSSDESPPRKRSYSLGRGLTIGGAAKDDDDKEEEVATTSQVGNYTFSVNECPHAHCLFHQMSRQRSGSMTMTKQSSKNLSQAIKTLKVEEKKKSETDLGKTLSRKDKDSNATRLWEEQLLNQLESVQALFLILFLVIVTTVYSVLQLVLDLRVDNRIAAVDFAVSITFIFELSIRMYLYATVHRELGSFIKQPLNSLDIVVVLLDMTLLVLDSRYLSNSANFTTSLK